MKLSTIVMGALLAVLCTRSGAGAAEREVTLAVVAGRPGLAPVAALVEVGLSQQGIRLVERAEIDRILQEQELSAGGLLDRETLVKVGGLLRADAFLLLSLEAPPKEAGTKPVPALAFSPEGVPTEGPEGPTPGLLRVRLVETVHGIRLLDWYGAWEPEKAEEAAEEVVKEAAGPAAKLSLPAGQLTPVGVVNVHRVLLGEEQEWLCRALKAMVSSRLSKEPRIVVLEREDLALLRAEKRLTQGAEDAFWASGALLEGTLERAGKDGMALRLQLRAAGAEPRDIAPFAVDAGTPAKAAEQAAVQVLAELTEAPPAGTWDPGLEAEQFWRQGAMLAWHGRAQDALPLLETAFALAPGNLRYAADLFPCAIEHSWQRSSPYSDLQRAELAARCTALLQRAMVGKRWDRPSQAFAGNLAGYMTSPESTSSERVREMNRGTRRVVRQLLQSAWGEGDAQRAKQMSTYHSARLAITEANTVDEAVQAIKELVNRKIMPPALGGANESFTDRADAAVGLVRGMPNVLAFGLAAHVFFDDYELPNKLFVYFQELAASDDPLVRFGGCLLCTCRVRAPQSYRMPAWTPPVDQGAYLTQAIDVFAKHLEARTDVSDAAARGMRNSLSTGIGVWRTAEDRIAFLERFLAPLAARGDANGLMQWPLGWRIQWDSIPAERRPSLQSVAHYVALLDRVVAALEPEAAREDVAGVLAVLWTATDEMKDELRYHLKDAGGSEVLRLLPELGRPPDRQVPARMLVRAGDWFHDWQFSKPGDVFARCTLQGSVLWVAFADNSAERAVGLVGMDLAAGRVVALWQTVTPTRREGFLALVGLAVRPGKSYVAVRDVGLVEFPGSDVAGKGLIDKPRVLGEEDGLPPGRLCGLAPHGDKLWVGYSGEGGSGLGLYDPKIGSWESVLLSTGHGSTPFEAGVRYEPKELLPLPEGLLFRALVPLRAPGDLPNLWLLREGSSAPEGLGRTDMQSGLLVDSPGGPWTFGNSALVRIALNEGKMQILMADQYGYAAYKQAEGQTLACVRKPFVQGRAEAAPELFASELGGLYGPGAAVRGDELWAPFGESRAWVPDGERQIIVLRRGTKRTDAQFIPNDLLEGKRVLHFLNTTYGLVAIGHGSVGLVESP